MYSQKIAAKDNGAIQEPTRSQLIGETPLAPALSCRPLPWMTANGRLIRKQGIQPDVAVELSADGEFLTPTLVTELTAEELTTSGDAQLLAGLEALDALPVTTEQAK